MNFLVSRCKKIVLNLDTSHLFKTLFYNYGCFNFNFKISKMADKFLETKRFTQIISQQREILREETEVVKVGVDKFLTRVTLH